MNDNRAALYSLTGSSGVNGDMVYAAEDGKLFILADGASGAGKDGKVLMGKICQETALEYTYSASEITAAEYVNNLLRKINERLTDVSREHNSYVFGTLDIALIEDGMLTVTSMGDSPMYLKNKYSISQIGRCPKKYEWMIDSGIITHEQYWKYIDSMHDMMKSCFDEFIPAVVPCNRVEQYPFTNGDMMVMCCDGLSDWLSAKDIFLIVNTFDLSDSAHRLCEIAKERALAEQNYYDDISVIIVSG